MSKGKKKKRTADAFGAPIEDTTAQGRARCLGLVRQGDQRGKQCRKPARPGFDYCANHGAGSRKREREGKRKNPIVEGAGTSLPANPTGRRLFFQERPGYQALYDRYASAPVAELGDLRDVLAELHALRDYSATLKIDDDLDFIKTRLGVIGQVLGSIRVATEIEKSTSTVDQQRRTITRQLVVPLIEAMHDVFRRFVPEEAWPEATEALRTAARSVNLTQLEERLRG